MKKIVAAVITLTSLVLAGCSTTPKEDRGPSGTVAYYIRVESSEAGVTIETNNVFAGKTPLLLRLFGNKDETFHNFGSPQYTVSAIPLNTNQYLQIQTFPTGTDSSPGDKIPGLIFFDMSRKNGALTIDAMPER